MKKNHADIIHCIGDSHVCFFNGRDAIHPEWPDFIGKNLPFKTYRLGTPLAYNLSSYNTKSRGREKLLDLLKLLPLNSTILFVFGEIDCRCHLGKQAELQERPINETVEECVNRYFDVITEVRNLGFNIGAWGVIPSTDFSKYEPDHPFPSYGTCQQRNIITKLFNNYLDQLCKINDIIFVSIFEEMLNIDLTANLDYYMDVNHLSQKAFPLAFSKIREVFQLDK